MPDSLAFDLAPGKSAEARSALRQAAAGVLASDGERIPGGV
jgi:hypothetical protein